ncbi:MAG: hypothetical protein K2K53_12950, partial [Oscillospiraceae bacterium]|nr:hypothetical protein [Oscillospiraceae bacterium]
GYGSTGTMSQYRAQSAFAFRWPRVVISVHAAEAKLTLNAYQAYTKGGTEDLSRALQTYSPTVLVRYSDGSQESVIMPWGRVLDPWTSCVVTEERDGTTVTVDDSNYDPTGGVY